MKWLIIKSFLVNGSDVLNHIPDELSVTTVTAFSCRLYISCKTII